MGVPLADRVLEVIADLGEDAKPRYRFGSGFIVRARTVLTAAHVVAGAKRIMVRGPDKVARSASLDPRFVGGGDLPDLALVEIDDVAATCPRSSWPPWTGTSRPPRRSRAATP